MGDVREIRPAGGLDASGRTGLRFELVRGLRRIINIEMERAQQTIDYEHAYLEQGDWTFDYEWVRFTRKKGGTRTIYSHNFYPGAPTPREVLAHGQSRLDLIDRAERAFNQERENPESAMWLTEAATYQTVLETLFAPYKQEAE